MSKLIYDINKIQELIPHRYPFLFIDKAEILEPGVLGVGYKNVTCNEPYFVGHFPGNPVMPGVIIVEAMAQTSAVVVISKFDNPSEVSHVYFMSVEEAKFRKPVLPGDSLAIEAKMVRAHSKVWKFSCQAHVDGEKVAEAMLTAMIVKKSL